MAPFPKREKGYKAFIKSVFQLFPNHIRNLTYSIPFFSSCSWFPGIYSLWRDRKTCGFIRACAGKKDKNCDQYYSKSEYKKCNSISQSPSIMEELLKLYITEKKGSNCSAQQLNFSPFQTFLYRFNSILIGTVVKQIFSLKKVILLPKSKQRLFFPWENYT